MNRFENYSSTPSPKTTPLSLSQETSKANPPNPPNPLSVAIDVISHAQTPSFSTKMQAVESIERIEGLIKNLSDQVKTFRAAYLIQDDSNLAKKDFSAQLERLEDSIKQLKRQGVFSPLLIERENKLQEVMERLEDAKNLPRIMDALEDFLNLKIADRLKNLTNKLINLSAFDPLTMLPVDKEWQSILLNLSMNLQEISELEKEKGIQFSFENLEQINQKINSLQHSFFPIIYSEAIKSSPVYSACQEEITFLLGQVIYAKRAITQLKEELFEQELNNFPKIQPLFSSLYALIDSELPPPIDQRVALLTALKSEPTKEFDPIASFQEFLTKAREIKSHALKSIRQHQYKDYQASLDIAFPQAFNNTPTLPESLKKALVDLSFFLQAKTGAAISFQILTDSMEIELLENIDSRGVNQRSINRLSEAQNLAPFHTTHEQMLIKEGYAFHEKYNAWVKNCWVEKKENGSLRSLEWKGKIAFKKEEGVYKHKESDSLLFEFPKTSDCLSNESKKLLFINFCRNQKDFERTNLESPTSIPIFCRQDLSNHEEFWKWVDKGMPEDPSMLAEKTKVLATYRQLMHGEEGFLKRGADFTQKLNEQLATLFLKKWGVQFAEKNTVFEIEKRQRHARRHATIRGLLRQFNPISQTTTPPTVEPLSSVKKPASPLTVNQPSTKEKTSKSFDIVNIQEFHQGIKKIEDFVNKSEAAIQEAIKNYSSSKFLNKNQFLESLKNLEAPLSNQLALIEGFHLNGAIPPGIEEKKKATKEQLETLNEKLIDAQNIPRTLESLEKLLFSNSFKSEKMEKSLTELANRALEIKETDKRNWNDDIERIKNFPIDSLQFFEKLRDLQSNLTYENLFEIQSTIKGLQDDSRQIIQLSKQLPIPSDLSSLQDLLQTSTLALRFVDHLLEAHFEKHLQNSSPEIRLLFSKMQELIGSPDFVPPIRQRIALLQILQIDHPHFNSRRAFNQLLDEAMKIKQSSLNNLKSEYHRLDVESSSPMTDLFNQNFNDEKLSAMNFPIPIETIQDMKSICLYLDAKVLIPNTQFTTDSMWPIKGKSERDLNRNLSAQSFLKSLPTHEAQLTEQGYVDSSKYKIWVKNFWKEQSAEDPKAAEGHSKVMQENPKVPVDSKAAQPSKETQDDLKAVHWNCDIAFKKKDNSYRHKLTDTVTFNFDLLSQSLGKALSREEKEKAFEVVTLTCRGDVFERKTPNEIPQYYRDKLNVSEDFWEWIKNEKKPFSEAKNLEEIQLLKNYQDLLQSDPLLKMAKTFATELEKAIAKCFIEETRPLTRMEKASKKIQLRWINFNYQLKKLANKIIFHWILLNTSPWVKKNFFSSLSQIKEPSPSVEQQQEFLNALKEFEDFKLRQERPNKFAVNTQSPFYQGFRDLIVKDILDEGASPSTKQTTEYKIWVDFFDKVKEQIGSIDEKQLLAGLDAHSINDKDSPYYAFFKKQKDVLEILYLKRTNAEFDLEKEKEFIAQVNARELSTLQEKREFLEWSIFYKKIEEDQNFLHSLELSDQSNLPKVSEDSPFFELFEAQHKELSRRKNFPPF